jgi:hypothetical protein
LFSGIKETPGVCSPSRRVVSKIFTFFGKQLGLDKAIPHFTSLALTLSREVPLDIRFMVKSFSVFRYGKERRLWPQKT